jgi:hypothetical protein
MLEIMAGATGEAFPHTVKALDCQYALSGAFDGKTVSPKLPTNRRPT